MLKIQKKDEQALKMETNIFLIKKILKACTQLKHMSFFRVQKKAYEKLYAGPILAENK